MFIKFLIVCVWCVLPAARNKQTRKLSIAFTLYWDVWSISIIYFWGVDWIDIIWTLKLKSTIEAVSFEMKWQSVNIAEFKLIHFNTLLNRPSALPFCFILIFLDSQLRIYSSFRFTQHSLFNHSVILSYSFNIHSNT